MQAYQLYMKGRFFWNRRTPDGFRQAIEYFNQATLRDPEYALAHSGLADCFALLSFYGALPPKVGYQRARAAATRALEIDDSLAEAHALGGLRAAVPRVGRRRRGARVPARALRSTPTTRPPASGTRRC